MKRIVIICCLLFVVGCADKLQFIDLEDDVRYSMIKYNQKLMSFKPPLGSWNQLRNIEQPKEDISRSSVILHGQSQYAWVDYRVRLGLQNVERFSQKMTRFNDALSSGDMLKSINTHIRDFYTEKLRKEIGFTEINGSLTEMGGYACTQIDETQNYGPDASNSKWGDNHLNMYNTVISCPMVIEDEIWELLSFYTITIATNHFNRYYGENLPDIDDIQKDLRTRLQPMFDSVIVYRNPSQNLPDNISLKD